MDIKCSQKLQKRDDYYLLAHEVKTIELEITGKMQHHLRAQHFGTACPYSRKLICSFRRKKPIVVLGQLLQINVHREMRLVKVHRKNWFKLFLYFSSYIANNTVKLKQFQR